MEHSSASIESESEAQTSSHTRTRKQLDACWYHIVLLSPRKNLQHKTNEQALRNRTILSPDRRPRLTPCSSADESSESTVGSSKLSARVRRRAHTPAPSADRGPPPAPGSWHCLATLTPRFLSRADRRICVRAPQSHTVATRLLAHVSAHAARTRDSGPHCMQGVRGCCKKCGVVNGAFCMDHRG